MSIQRRVALIGSGEGPWVSTQGLRQPRVKVTGMKAGGAVIVTVCDSPQGFHRETSKQFRFEENGIHLLEEAPWMRVECSGGGRGVICDILTKKAVA